MFKSRRELMQFGFRLMKQLHNHFVGSQFESEVYDNEHQSLIVSGGLRFAFRQWGGKPAYIILFKGTKYVFELDLSRAIETNGRFTWYLSRPSHFKNRELLNRISKWKANVPPNYRESLREQKMSLKSGSVIPNGGYLFLRDSDRKHLESSFLDFFDKIINIHLSDPNTHSKELYNLDDARAIEGYQSDKRYLHTKRNQSLVDNRKRRDNFACQVCAFRLQIKGRYIIECHHTKPLAGGKSRVTSIDDLVCLCPTCHRIAHIKSPPFSVFEIKSLRRQVTK